MIVRTIGMICALVALAAGCSRMGLQGRQMTEGERLFRANCRACHVLPKPEAFSDEAWPEFVSSHAGGSSIPEHTKALISQYLVDSN